MKKLYFDYNASAPAAEGLKDNLCRWLDYKNPSSSHEEGRAAKSAIEAARKRHLELFGTSPGDRLVFTSGGTEANNTIFRSAFHNRGTKTRLVLTNVEHSSVYNSAKALEKLGAVIDWIIVDSKGRIDLDEYRKKLGEDVFLVSVMLANNETGFVLPVKEMAAIAREAGISFHTDAVCATAKMSLSFSDLGVDYLTFSSHKFGALKGVGGIVMKKTAKLVPLIVGGPHEQEKRAGTENVPGILSSAYALEKSCSNLASTLQQMEMHRMMIKNEILRLYPAAVFIESATNLPQTLNVSFPGLAGNVLLANLDLEGVEASYGSACASGALEVSRVMKSLALPMDQASAALRFSFGASMTEADVKDFLQRLALVLSRMSKESAA